MRRSVLWGVCLLSLSFGCAEIFGLGDYSEADGGDALISGDSGAEVGPSSDSGPDADAGNADAWDGALQVSEAGCTTGFTCVPRPANGWTFVGYNQISRQVSCPGSYGASIPVSENPSGAPATCGCSCALATPPCSLLTITAGDGGANGCQNHANFTGLAATGTCTLLPGPIPLGNAVSASIIDNGSCSASPSVTVTPPTTSSQGLICELLTTPTTGCEAGLECVPEPAPYNECIYKPNYQAGDTCPPGYSVMHVVGTTYSDTRGCTACTCAYDGGGACSGTVTLAAAGNCGGGSTVGVNADGTCQPTSGNGSYTNYKFSSNGGGTPTCTPSSPTPTGGVTYQDPPGIVCCTQ